MNAIPPTSELFPQNQLVQRHPTILFKSRVEWAIRNRHKNGLEDAVFESKGGEILIHEPEFLRWFLGLRGRAQGAARTGPQAAEQAPATVPELLALK
jgi:hypothetical protein